MAQMQRSKVGSRKKGRRSSKDKPYYAAYRLRYPGKLIRRKADRERRIKLAREKPHIGSPSQLRQRMKKGLLQRSPLRNVG